jgi:hypothetical protein
MPTKPWKLNTLACFKIDMCKVHGAACRCDCVYIQTYRLPSLYSHRDELGNNSTYWGATKCFDYCFVQLCTGPVWPKTYSILPIKILLQFSQIIYTSLSQCKKCSISSPPYTADCCLTDYIWQLIQNVFICNVIPVHFTYCRIVGAGEVSPARIKNLSK